MCADVIRLAGSSSAEVTEEELFPGSLSGHEGLAAGAAEWDLAREEP
jgi:hypothetical protein